MPFKSTSPRLGKKCGRRERESRRGVWREQSVSPRASRVVAAQGILVFWKAALFAGRRRNEGLGRSVVRSGYPPATDVAPMTADVRRALRRGTSSRMRTGACTRRRHERSSHALGRRVLHSVLRPVLVDPHYTRGAKSVFVVGRLLRHHGWANPRKWEEPTLGSGRRTLRGSPRVTASARESAWHVRRKGRRSRPPSLRGSRVPVGLLARRVQVAEVCKRQLASNKLGTRAPKRAGRVE